MFKKSPAVLLLIALAWIIPLTISAQFGLEYATALDLGTTDVRAAAIEIINVILGFLGILCILLMLYAGFLWLTSGGNEEKITKAKKTLISAIIGLIIVLASYGIVRFILGEVSSSLGLRESAVETQPLETCADGDGDGYADEFCGGSDCADFDPLVNPGTEEICDDSVDNDCDELADSQDPDCAGASGLEIGGPYECPTTKPDPSYYELLGGVQLKPQELPAITAEEMADRETFIDIGIARSQCVVENYQDINPSHRFKIGGVNPFAHEASIKSVQLGPLLKYIKYLKEANVELVGLHIGIFPWLLGDEHQQVRDDTIAKYDALIDKIYAEGMQPRLMIPLSNSAASDYPELEMHTWDDYRNNILSMVETVVQRYAARGTPLVMVGTHEPSNIPKILSEVSYIEPAQYKTFINSLCDVAKSADGNILCTASLIPGPEAGGERESEWEYQSAVLKSNADLLGVNNVLNFYGLHPDTIYNTDLFIEHFKNGMEDENGEWIEGRGEVVFLNAIGRPTWAQTLDIPHSNGSGLGCSEYGELDEAYFTALFNYARAHQLLSLSPFYTMSFIHQQACPHTTHMYSYVVDPEAGECRVLTKSGCWFYYQEGNAITDLGYSLDVAAKLASPQVELTATGEFFRGLAAQFSN